MDEKQYDQTVHNRRGYDLRPLFDGAGLEAVLRRAARMSRQRRLADEAWRRAVSPEVAATSGAISFRDGVLVICVSDPTTGHHLRSRAAELRRRLAAALPSLRQVRFVKDDAAPEIPGGQPG